MDRCWIIAFGFVVLLLVIAFVLSLTMGAKKGDQQLKETQGLEEKYHKFLQCAGMDETDIFLDEYREYIASLGISTYSDHDVGLTDSQMHDGGIDGTGYDG